MEIKKVKHSDLARCPKLNLLPSHYWNDGQCRCEPRIGVVIVRDPDGGTAVQVFVDGRERQVFDRIVVDAGAGHVWDDWTEGRDHDLAFSGEISKQFQEATAAAYDDPPGGQYVEGREEEPWLPPTEEWSKWI